MDMHPRSTTDRRVTPLGRQYQVFWVRQRINSRRYYLKTWEPEVKLREDGFAEEMDLVDRWKVSKVEKFETF
ncbi:hypothetical protein PC128_g1727 [Phytophthora cactorum]|nr:hypothetical protein PC120_g2703 [Phytophthora cactorum]KAG3204865.1 hypothetical protein PC128_g1727 [Phytophthora cactorum]KAG4063976.1 hypothetical protein PC123_g1220 [Phytophthora cactorum]